jgi:hypothetical protein
VVVLPPVVPVEPVPVVDDEVAVLQPRRMKKRPEARRKLRLTRSATRLARVGAGRGMGISGNRACVAGP